MVGGAAQLYVVPPLGVCTTGVNDHILGLDLRIERRGPGIAYRYARALRIRAIWFMRNNRSTSIPFDQYDEYAGSAKLV